MDKKKITRMGDDLLIKYYKIILNPTPSDRWKKIRLMLHWLTIPIKLFIIGTNSILMHVYMLFFVKRRKLVKLPNKEIRKEYFKKVYTNLPLLKNDIIKLYTCRVPTQEIPDGKNHNTDHQAGRHGTYAFIMNRLGIPDNKIDKATQLHMQGPTFFRGYKGGRKGMEFNNKTIAGDQILGICLALLDAKKQEWHTDSEGDILTPGPENQQALLDTFDQAAQAILDNDYSCLEGSLDPKDPLAVEVQKVMPVVKSTRANWAPGLETVGAQSITLLAIVKVLEKKCNSRRAQKEYKKLLWGYGYGLLSLFPTTFIPTRRGYFNDHNTIVAAYILAKLTDSKLGKLYWTFVMLYIWSLSYKQYNGYFTGLLKDVAPWLVTQKYLDKCKQYLYEEEPNTYTTEFRGYVKRNKFVPVPVKYNQMNTGGEFHPDEQHQWIDPNGQGPNYHRNGLGWFAACVMIDKKESKEFVCDQT